MAIEISNMDSLIDVSLIGSYLLTHTLCKNPTAGLLLKTGFNHRTGQHVLAQVHTKALSPHLGSAQLLPFGAERAIDRADTDLFSVVVMQWDENDSVLLREIKHWMIAMMPVNSPPSLVSAAAPPGGCSEKAEQNGIPPTWSSPASTLGEPTGLLTSSVETLSATRLVTAKREPRKLFKFLRRSPRVAPAAA